MTVCYNASNHYYFPGLAEALRTGEARLHVKNYFSRIYCHFQRREDGLYCFVVQYDDNRCGIVKRKNGVGGDIIR